MGHTANIGRSQPELAKSTDLQALRLHELMEIQTKSMAQALHDGAGQMLAAAYLKLDEAASLVPAANLHSVRELQTMLDCLEAELRRISHELHPMVLEDLGLLPALEFLKHGVAKRTGLRISVTGSLHGRLPADIEIALYRIVYEALGDVARHAKASHVAIAIWRDGGGVSCSICDNGCGVDPDSCRTAQSGRGMGFHAIRARVEDLNGSCLLHSAPGRSTKLSVTIPIQN